MAMPIGRLRPSSATAMPVKPIPVWMVEPKACEAPNSSGMPISPATAPESSIA